MIYAMYEPFLGMRFHGEMHQIQHPRAAPGWKVGSGFREFPDGQYFIWGYYGTHYTEKLYPSFGV